MILPVLSYGHPILRQKCKDADKDYPDLGALIDNMWETLYAAKGVGLAGSQVNHAIKLFIVDSKQVFDNMEEDNRNEIFEGDEGIVETFINARITEESGEYWTDSEGCLSIPTLNGDVDRAWSITIEYSDRDFNRKTAEFAGETARIIQHEYDHTYGVLYLNHLKPVKRNLIQNKLKKIVNGDVDVKYKMKFLK
jgi:peptide deformylase